MDLFTVVAEQLFASLRESKKDSPKKEDESEAATRNAITKRYEEMLNEVVNNDGQRGAVGGSSSSSTSKHSTSSTDGGTSRPIASSEALIGQLNGNDVDWETKLRESLQGERKPKHRSKKDCVERAEKLQQELDKEGTFFVPGEKPFGKNKHNRVVKLPMALPPKEMFYMVSHEPRAVEIRFPEVKEELTINNYERKFDTLLKLDEVECVISMRQYDLDGVSFRRADRGFLALEVPGLADGRPSLMPGDAITAKQVHSNHVYQGFVHIVEKDEVMLKFHPTFHDNYKGDAYNVTFKESRTQIRRCHWAVQQSKTLPAPVLFPLNAIQFQAPLLTVTLDTVKWVNRNLNQRQRNAVVNVLRSECRPSPYIIFGPPGTGKTMTIVECILQVYKNFPRSRILACSGSNACADLIATKLLDSGMVNKDIMIRVIAHNRVDRVPDNLKEYSKPADDDLQSWLYHRIIIATCSNVGAIIDKKPRDGHFTHTFIDEAAQATEPESLLPVLQSALAGGSTILAGDPFQLGPMIMSKIAKQFGLGVPLMARLCEMKPYKRNVSMYQESGHYDPRCITKLVESYRCCSELIHINSKLFYHSELVCKLDQEMQLLQRMKVKFPIIFDAVQGTDIQEPDNPSWCNLAEVLTCTKYLLDLYQIGLTPDDVGIITPYRKQAEKIRRFVESLGRPVCKIATIEEFQGGERKVIIVSMVRSTAKNISHDLKFGLGFIFNDKRFNVATSRAKSLLIVIGDPNVLIRDECWKMFLGYCKLNQATTGVPFTVPDEIPDLPEDLLDISDSDSDHDSMFDSPPEDQ